MARPMTMAEKILADHAGLEEVVPGQLVECDLDLVLANDVTAPIAVKESVREMGAGSVVRSRDRITPGARPLQSPTRTSRAPSRPRSTRDFARERRTIQLLRGRAAWAWSTRFSPEQGVVVRGRPHDRRGQPSHLHVRRASSAFSTGVGSTDAGVGMRHRARVRSRCPSRMPFEIEGALAPRAPPARTSSCTSSGIDRRGRRAVRRRGVRRLRHRGAHGRGRVVMSICEHGHRGGRQGRPLRGGRQVPRAYVERPRGAPLRQRVPARTPDAQLRAGASRSTPPTIQPPVASPASPALEHAPRRGRGPRRAPSTRP